MIDSKTFDPNFKSLIASEPGGENIKKCFSCGTCTAGCPVREVTDRYNPRRIIRMAILGMKKEVLSSDFIWLCSSCYTCFERCPQNVKIPELMNAIKNIAVREGNLPSTMKSQLDLLASANDHVRLSVHQDIVSIRIPVSHIPCREPFSLKNRFCLLRILPILFKDMRCP